MSITARKLCHQDCMPDLHRWLTRRGISYMDIPLRYWQHKYSADMIMIIQAVANVFRSRPDVYSTRICHTFPFCFWLTFLLTCVIQLFIAHANFTSHTSSSPLPSHTQLTLTSSSPYPKRPSPLYLPLFISSSVFSF